MDVDRMTVDQQVEFIKTELAKALDGYIGKAIDLEDAKATVVNELHHIFGLPDRDAWLIRLANILVFDWAGIPEGADPKRDLAEVPTVMLDEFVGRLSGEVGVAAGLVMLEWQRRHGHIIDWSFERIDRTHAKTILHLKHPINFVLGEFEVKP